MFALRFYASLATNALAMCRTGRREKTFFYTMARTSTQVLMKCTVLHRKHKRCLLRSMVAFWLGAFTELLEMSY